jgi:hypothetical protein
MSVTAELEKIPPGVLAAVVVGVALLALMSNKGSSANGGYGLVRAYEPTPMDPGVVAMHNAELAAKSEAVRDALAVSGAQDISRVTAGRDISLATIMASRDTFLADRAYDSQDYQTGAAREIGMAEITTGYQLGIEQVRAAASLGLAAIGADERTAAGGFATERYRVDAGERLGTAQLGTAERIAFGGYDVDRFGISSAERVAADQTSVDRYRAGSERRAQPSQGERILSDILDFGKSIAKYIPFL